MSVSTIGVVQESAEGERRVALSPDGVQRLKKAGHEVLVETGAGGAAWFPDSEYEAAGARLVSKHELYERADAVLCVQAPAEADRALLRPGQVLVGLLQPLTDPQSAAGFAVAKVTAISLDGLPRTVSRAQSMDALSSQANVAGYKAA
ncbi:MAG: NAD(P) transhydrogenase subunit alpha, partial [Chloroflexota bacterium]|nr:NAD(P) transhydrogenase subunit alpha [Chloroflexota bacterium]